MTKLSFLALAAAALASPAVAAWDYKLIEDPMTDAKRGISVLEADQGALVIKCDRNGPGSLYLSIISKNYLGGLSSNRRRTITYRVDQGQPQTIPAYHDGSTANVLDLAPETKEGRFFAQIMTASRLVVQVTSFNYDTYTIVFDMTGARDAVNRSAAACGDTNWIAAGTVRPVE